LLVEQIVQLNTHLIKQKDKRVKMSVIKNTNLRENKKNAGEIEKIDKKQEMNFGLIKKVVWLN